MLLCLDVHMKLVWDVPRAVLMLMAGQGGLYWRWTRGHCSDHVWSILRAGHGELLAQTGTQRASHYFCALFAEVCWQLQPRSRRR